jgi:hypothetical protein
LQIYKKLQSTTIFTPTMSCLLQKTSGILLELALLLFPAQTPRYALSGKILCAKRKNYMPLFSNNVP